MLWKRIASAIIGIPALILIFYTGKLPLLILIILLTMLGLREFINISKSSGLKEIPLLLGLSGLVFPVMINYYPAWSAPIMFGFILLSFSYYLYFYPTYSTVDLGFALMGMIYISLGFSHFLLLRHLENGFWLIVYAFLVIWSTDTGAYFTGMCLGRHKFAPLISPHKTWEGFLGGLVLSLATIFVFTLYVPLSFSKTLLYITPVVCVVGQVGDLFESSLKRFAKIKDSGQVIPGHGGILDRFDSALWSVPLTYYLLVIIEGL